MKIALLTTPGFKDSASVRRILELRGWSIVKKNPDYKPGQEVQWFKVLITDNETGKTKVKVTLPIAVVEAVLKCASNEKMKILDDDCDLDLKELFAELKKHGPMVFIEINDDDENVSVKIWLE